MIETNIRQRGVGNPNTVKFGRCVAELERIYGIRQGRPSEENETNGRNKTQSDLAEDLGVDKKTLQRAKKLAELPEEFQQMVMDGKITPSTASRMIARLTPEEQKQLAEQISGRRNLSAYDRSVLALKLKPIIAEKAKRQQARTAENRVHQISDKQEIDTKKEVAKVAGVRVKKHSQS